MTIREFWVAYSWQSMPKKGYKELFHTETVVRETVI